MCGVQIVTFLRELLSNGVRDVRKGKNVAKTYRFNERINNSIVEKVNVKTKKKFTVKYLK